MAQQQLVRRKTQASKTPVSIPDKLYFRIGDVARLCSLPAYVLRFWETEFPQLKPNKGGTGQRLYRKRDVEMVLEIKRLLYEEGFTIAGARRLLAEKRRSLATPANAVPSVTDDRHEKRKAVLAVEEPRTSSRALKAEKAAPSKPLPDRPRIKELREEMRELLAMLGSDPSERKPPPTSSRNAKKARQSDEPTLF